MTKRITLPLLAGIYLVAGGFTNAAMLLAAQPTARGWQVQCRVSNERSRAAEQVVLNLELTDSQGRVLAANPLAAVPNLAAADTRDVFFVIPFREPVTNAQVQAEVSLVRWRQ